MRGVGSTAEGRLKRQSKEKICKLSPASNLNHSFERECKRIIWGMGSGEWGVGSGEWELGIGSHSPLPTPHSPSPTTAFAAKSESGCEAFFPDERIFPE